MDGEVHVTAERTLLHPAVTHTRVLDDRLQLVQVRDSLLRRANIRLRHDFNQRNAAAVAVDERPLLRVMHELARVLLDVDARDANALLARFRLHHQVPADAQRQVILADLVRFGQVGIEIILSVLLGVTRNRAARRQPCQHRVMHHLPIEHRQRAGKAHTDRAALRVRRCAEGRRAGAEDFGLRFQLHMNLQADDHFVSVHHLPSHYSVASLQISPSASSSA